MIGKYLAREWRRGWTEPLPGNVVATPPTVIDQAQLPLHKTTHATNSGVTLWGSTIALVIGLLSILAALSQASQGQANSGLEAGIAMIGGAAAYRALKVRKSGSQRRFTNAAIDFLGLLAVAVVAFLGLSSGLAQQDSFQFIVIPLWAFIAYGILFFHSSHTRETKHATAQQAEQSHGYTAELQHLKKLKDDGVLTEDEFKAKKKQVLNI